ncbi:aggregation-promoting factor [Periweissella fabalis]|uniref:LysM peptidoglycan-binding domain-containing protein n=1 Tax=Periweissella fabalis TaxID=1070421 RepID=A0A7X6S306_9LACO|nr:LysM domain-containing protein [Periweissella fabalis]MCM0599837.1 LysM peptidoglycan-binding domain-containing protein [Periweissella fabalis]NKZ24108.1 LysM peptidoglycan-binding domain-containing protein [Periweissella fabalis]
MGIEPLNTTSAFHLQPTYPGQASATDKNAFAAALATTDVPQIATIHWGDTLSALAATYHTTVAQLATINHISNPDMIYAGNQLIIPKTTTDETVSLHNQAQAPMQSVKPVSTNSGNTSNTSIVPTLNPAEHAARDYIVTHESHGSYTARNGKYIGKYQLDQSYLNGDFSPANQERVAQTYVTQRYGSWTNAMTHWQTHHWY